MEQKNVEASSSQFPRDRIEGGVSVEQLKKMLEAELEKDAAQIDTEYADRLVALILEAPAQEKVTVQEESPSPAAPVAFPTARHNRVICRMARIAAMLVLVCTITGITQAWVRLKTGYVFNADEQRIEWHTNLGDMEFTQETYKLPLCNTSADSTRSESTVLPSGILLAEKDIPEQLYGHPVINLTKVDGYSLNHAMMITDAVYVTLYQSYNTPHGTAHIQTTIFFDFTGNFLINTETNNDSFHIEFSNVWKDYDTWSAYIPFNTGYSLIWGTSEQEIKFLYNTFKGASQ